MQWRDSGEAKPILDEPPGCSGRVLVIGVLIVGAPGVEPRSNPYKGLALPLSYAPSLNS
jgi:hypothetical protein